MGIKWVNACKVSSMPATWLSSINYCYYYYYCYGFCDMHYDCSNDIFPYLLAPRLSWKESIMSAKTKGNYSCSLRWKHSCSWGECSGPSYCWSLSRVKCTKPSHPVKNWITSQSRVSRQRLGTDNREARSRKDTRETAPQRQITISPYWEQFSLWVSFHYSSLFGHRAPISWVIAEGLRWRWEAW